ncbi:MAG: hypothetical protein IPN61_04855 [Bacteroidetes bacterium]|nr:hypothetical protein [Bacteroidota bacterium]
MNNLISLRNLIKKLTSEEMKILTRIAQSTSKSNLKNENKTLLLVQLLLVEPNLNSSEIQKNIYSSSNYAAFNKLCSRLREKILDSILLESSIDQGGYSKRNKIVFELKKKLIQADILNLKGLREQADSICKKVISISNDYEIYDLTIQSLITREKFVRLRKNQKEVIKVVSEIKITNLKFESFRMCQSDFNSIMNKIATAGNEMSYFDELKNTISHLQQEYNLYASKSTGYYLQLLKTQMFQNEKKYIKADISLDTALSMLKSKSVYSDNRMGSVLLSKSENYIKLHKFEESLSLSNRSIEFFPNNIFNQALVHECKFYANYFGGEFDKSRDSLTYLCSLPKENNILISINKWNYLASALLFIEKKYSQCIEQLKQISEIDKDKEGWNVNIRILMIMCRIEIGDTDSVDLNVSNLEKFVKRISKKGIIPTRYKVILRVLVALSNESFNFKKVKLKKQKYLELLNTRDLELSWEIKGPELIPFNIWFENKCNPSGGPLYNQIISSI